MNLFDCATQATDTLIISTYMTGNRNVNILLYNHETCKNRDVDGQLRGILYIRCVILCVSKFGQSDSS